MEIFLCNRWYPPYTGWGGVAAYQYYLAHALSQSGHGVHVLAARWNSASPAIQQDGAVTIHRLLMPGLRYLHRLPVLKRYRRTMLQYQYSHHLVRFINQLSASLNPAILEFAEINAEPFHYLKKKSRLPVVVRTHTPTFILKNYYTPAEMPYETRWISRMEKYCIQHANALSAPSHDMARVISQSCSSEIDRLRVIPNLLDTSVFTPPANKFERQVNSNSLTVLHVGRLDRTKGIEVLAHAIPLVLKHYPKTRFIFIGDDCPDGHGSTWQQRLQQKFTALNIQSNVSFMGSINQAELLHWYQQADLAVVPTILYESFSYTCAQAMSAGLPVVASRIGGIPETLADCGSLVTPGNIQELTAALLELIKNPELRHHLGRLARERAVRLYDSRVVSEQILSFYSEIARGI